MKEQEMMQFCTAVRREAEKSGIADYEIYAVYGEDFSVTVEGGEIEQYSVNEFSAASLRLMQDGKTGYASTTALAEDGIPALIAAAKENAAAIESKEQQFLFEGSAQYTYPKVSDERVNAADAAEKIRFARALEQKALALDPRVVRTEGSYVMSGEKTRVILNSRGLSLKETSSSIGAYVVPIAEIDGNMNSGFAVAAGFSLDDIDMDALAKESVKSAIDFCGAKSTAGKPMRVIFENRAAADLLATFSSVFFAENAQKGLSLLSGKENTKIASAAISLSDDALIDGGYGSRAFDDEGVAGQKTVVVENGVLKTLLYNLKTAARAGVASTGNATKAGYSSPIATAVTNFCIKPGSAAKEELIASLSDGILITEVSGLHSGANPVTGDFSLTAQGYLLKDGKIGRPVSCITVSGNFYHLLRDVEAVGSDLYISPFGAAVGSPSLLVAKEMSVSGSEEA